MKEYLDMWKNYANFSGRTSVRGYWMAFLFNFIASLIASFIPVVSFIYPLAALIPGLAIAVRRLRDTGKRWTWLFISLVPLAGSIILIIMLCKPSAPIDAEPAAV